MPLIINNNFNPKNWEEITRNEIKVHVDSYSAAIESIIEVDLIFLKSCGYYEMLIDQILENVGYGIQTLENMGVATKIKTLNGNLQIPELKESTEYYLKLTSARNSLAHKPAYKLEKDVHFLEQILKLATPSKENIKNAVIKFFVEIYTAPLFVVTGIKLQGKDSSFLTFASKNELSSAQQSK